MAIRIRTISAALLVVAVVGCEGDSADLVREIDAAREGCTQEKLRAGDEECIRMFETYAGMGTEAIHTYIGAMKAFDAALQRMPPPQFDTAGLGHALTPRVSSERPPAAYLSPDPSRQLRRETPRAYGYDEYDAYDPQRDRWAAPSDRQPRRGEHRLPREERGPWDPRIAPRDQENWRSGYPAPYDEGYARGGGYLPEYEEDEIDRYGGSDEWLDRRDSRGQADPRPARERGLLLPPSERLDRPWLREDEPRRPRGTAGYPPPNRPIR